MATLTLTFRPSHAPCRLARRPPAASPNVLQTSPQSGLFLSPFGCPHARMTFFLLMLLALHCFMHTHALRDAERNFLSCRCTPRPVGSGLTSAGGFMAAAADSAGQSPPASSVSPAAQVGVQLDPSTPSLVKDAFARCLSGTLGELTILAALAYSHLIRSKSLSSTRLSCSAPRWRSLPYEKQRWGWERAVAIMCWQTLPGTVQARW
ncbi:hypothetical protein OG21DRAFT_566249 [Imleria badia]|nr:hypothetical protein OG21DRAFT_566249 [Imleria badia]